MKFRVRNIFGSTFTRAALTLSAVMLIGCEDPLNKMDSEARLMPMEPNEFFENGQSARPIVEGTVARGQAYADAHLYTGRVNGQLVNEFPFLVTRDVLHRGQQQFNIYCAPCHSATGDGNGMIVRRGFTPPPSLIHLDSRPMNEREQYLQAAPPGHFFEVITNGIGAMYPYRDRVKVEDRWAIAAYIEALQLSNRADGSLVAGTSPATPAPATDSPEGGRQ